MEKLIKVLKESPIAAYKIEEVNSESVELFYVLNKLETNRATSIHEIEVSIYVDMDGKRGNASFSYNPFMSEEELKELVAKKIYAAKFALNPFYEIPAPSEDKPLHIPSNFENYSLLEAGEKVVKALLAAKQYKEGTYSANEIFVKKTTLRILNSKGVDLSSTSYKGFVELIPAWEVGEEEVETYTSFKFSNLDEADITAKAEEAMLFTKARFEAKDLKLDKPVKVIIEGEDAPQYFRFFVNNLSYNYKFMHMNRFELGDDVQEGGQGDKLNITLLPIYEGASASRAFDDDGVVLHEVEIVKDGIAKSLHGNYTFGYYLGIENPTGSLPICKVAPGSKSFEEMKKEPYVRCVKFSSFQFEEQSGFFGGEVRLGFYFDGEKEIPVTGFSIAGNIHESKKNTVFSKEIQVKSRYVGPKYLEFKDMTIN